MKTPTAQDAISRIYKLANPEKAAQSQRFFKTEPGEYAHGDIFVGVSVPMLRKIAKAFINLKLTEVKKLLKSKIHEQRLLALFILVLQYQQADIQTQEKIYTFYLKHTQFINNWDLVDSSAYHIVGAYLINKSKNPLKQLAKSNHLWERRIAIVATYQFIKHDKYPPTLDIAKMLLHDEHDLIHKATGWMLREVGKKNQAVEEAFLDKYAHIMPRTMLRYAIERLSPTKRKQYLNA